MIAEQDSKFFEAHMKYEDALLKLECNPQLSPRERFELRFEISFELEKDLSMG